MADLSNGGEHALDHLRFLLECLDAGQRCALITVVGIVDTAARPLGAHMVVVENGDLIGSVSSGCVDATVAEIARECLRSGSRRHLQLGAGSPFVDLQLPCGGGLELLIVPDPAADALRAAQDALIARRPCALRIDPDQLSFDDDASVATGWAGESFRITYEPRLRLVLAGRGPELRAFCHIALAAGFEVLALGPDAPDLAACADLGAEIRRLNSAGETPRLDADRWSAVVLLYHDHDWEPALLEAALATEAFYIGALGSRRTQAARLALLRERGATEDQLARIHGPIGLVPSMRHAPLLAISALAEIVGEFNGGGRVLPKN
jgi:xanthine dehydrogenase accessory factor